MPAPSATVRLLAVAIVTAVALSAAPAPAQMAAPSPAEVRYQTKVFKIVNNIRANHGRVKLKKNKCLQRFANKHAQNMADQRRLFHQPGQRVINRCGLSWYGENVVYGPFTAKQAVKRWMNSDKGHRENILRPRYRITGVAARKAGGYWWVAQVFGRKG